MLILTANFDLVLVILLTNISLSFSHNLDIRIHLVLVDQLSDDYFQSWFSWQFVIFSWKTGRMRATCTITKTEKRRGCTVSLGQIKCADQPHCTSRSLPNRSRLSIRLNFSSDWIPSLQNIFILFAFVGKSANIVFVLMHQFLFN